MFTQVRTRPGAAGARSVSSIYICHPVCKAYENIHACFDRMDPWIGGPLDQWDPWTVGPRVDPSASAARRSHSPVGVDGSVPEEELVLVRDLLVLLQPGLGPLGIGVGHGLEQGRAHHPGRRVGVEDQP